MCFDCKKSQYVGLHIKIICNKIGYLLKKTVDKALCGAYIEHMNKQTYVLKGGIMGEDIKTKAAADIAKNMPAEEYLYDLADLFRIFGDTTRIRILYSLFDGELCVGDISTILGMSQSSVSHQLRILKDSKLVKFRRDGKSIFYSLDDDHVRSILDLGMEHLEE